MKTLVVGSSDIDIFVAPESKSSYVVDQKTVAFTLGDKVPVDLSGLTLGGNGANVSVGLSRLGQEVSFYTYFGEDLIASQIKEIIKKENIQVVEHGQHTKNSSLSLIFDFADDRVIFSHHEKLNHAFDKSKVDEPQALYLTSLGEEWSEAYKNVLLYVHEHPLMLAFSPGSHQLAAINDLIFEVISVSKILFVNKEEGERILDKKGQSAATITELLQKLSLLGPEIVSVTNGKDGGYTLVEGKTYAVPSFDQKEVGVDKTGAGDAYAAGFFGAVLQGKDVKTAMLWGAAEAQSVMGSVGAQNGLLTTEQIESMLGARPDFQVTQM